MITQKDMHNILVKMDMSYKAKVAKQCNFDVEKIKEFESMLANICNISIETVSKVLDYMSKEI